MKSTLIALALLSPTSLAGQVLVVGSGPGQLPSIQDAVTLAADGDIVLVKTVGPHAPIRIQGKSVAIVGDLVTPTVIQGSVRVSNLAPSQSVVIQNVYSTGIVSTAVPDLGPGLWAKSCLGHVLAQDCRFDGCTASFCNPLPPRGGVEAENCASVSLTRCVVNGGAGPMGFLTSPLQAQVGPGLKSVAATSLAVYATTIVGGQTGYTCNAYHDGVDGGDGILTTATFQFVAGSTIRGGNGTSAGPSPLFGWAPGNGGHGVHGLVSGPNVFRQRASTVTGGTGAPGACPSCGEYGDNGLPHYLVSPQLLAGMQPLLSGTSLVRDDQPALFTVSAPAGSTVQLGVSTSCTFLWDAASSSVQHGAAPVWSNMIPTSPSSTTFTGRYRVPNLRLSDPGRIYYAQARVTSPTGVPTLTNVHVVVLVDASY